MDVGNTSGSAVGNRLSVGHEGPQGTVVAYVRS